MHKFRAALVGLLCLWALGGCTTNTSLPNVNATTVVTMALAVGEINDTAGVLHKQATRNGASGAGTFLDAIAVFRNQFGNSAFTNPGAAELSPIAGDPGPCNFTTGANCNVGRQNAFGGGQNADVVGYGNIYLRPSFCPPFPCPEFVLNGLTGQPPAFPLGAPTGYLQDTFQGTPPPPGFGDLPPLGAGGTVYTLTDQVNVNGTTQSYSFNATLNAVPTALGAPPNAAYTPVAGTGGGSFAIGAYPAGVTEQVVVVLSGAPPATVLAMAEAVSPATTATLPASTLAVGAYQCFVIGADFPWVEAGQNLGIANPVIVGLNLNADLSAGGTYACSQT